MRRTVVSGLLTLTLVLTAVVGFRGEAEAGQFKRLNGTATLPVGGQVIVHASPVNQGLAMEMDTYEFLSRPAGAQYRIRILANATGRALNVSFIGVNATIITRCTTAVNGLCNTPAIGLVGNLLFQAIVATQNGAPVAAGAHYVIAIQRTA